MADGSVYKGGRRRSIQSVGSPSHYGRICQPRFAIAINHHRTAGKEVNLLLKKKKGRGPREGGFGRIETPSVSMNQCGKAESPGPREVWVNGSIHMVKSTRG